MKRKMVIAMALTMMLCGCGKADSNSAKESTTEKTTATTASQEETTASETTTGAEETTAESETTEASTSAEAAPDTDIAEPSKADIIISSINEIFFPIINTGAQYAVEVTDINNSYDHFAGILLSSGVRNKYILRHYIPFIRIVCCIIPIRKTAVINMYRSTFWYCRFDLCSAVGICTET